MEENETTGGPSRRKVLKSIGVTTGFVWAAPTVAGLESAHAAGGSPQPCSRCRPTSCCDGTNNPPPCPGGADPCGSPDCFCGQTTEGDCGCFQQVFGAGGACTDSSTCPSGERCVGVCAGTFCIPTCTPGQAGTAADGPSPLTP